MKDQPIGLLLDRVGGSNWTRLQLPSSPLLIVLEAQAWHPCLVASMEDQPFLNWSSIESVGRTEPRSSKPSRTLFWSSVVRPGSGDCFHTLLACRLQQRISRMGLIIDRVAGRN